MRTGSHERITADDTLLPPVLVAIIASQLGFDFPGWHFLPQDEEDPAIESAGMLALVAFFGYLLRRLRYIALKSPMAGA